GTSSAPRNGSRALPSHAACPAFARPHARLSNRYLEAFHRGDQLLAIPRTAVELRRDTAAHHHDEPRADPQVFEVVRYEQDCNSFLAGACERVQQSLLR